MHEGSLCTCNQPGMHLQQECRKKEFFCETIKNLQCLGRAFRLGITFIKSESTLLACDWFIESHPKQRSLDMQITGAQRSLPLRTIRLASLSVIEVWFTVGSR